MAASSEYNGEVLYRAGQDSDASDIWDDTALIEAYDRAVNIMKNGNFKNDSGKGKGSGKSRNKKKKKSNMAAENQELSSIKWQVGDSCLAIFSEDGEIYDAVIISINSENETCAVKYDGYGNVEEQYLKNLVLPSANKSNKATKDADKGYYTVDSPHHNRPVHSRTETETSMEWSSSQQTPHPSSNQWRVSDICLAPEQPSGHWHEAVINSFPTPYTCQVTFLRSRKSQQVDKSQLYHSSTHHDHPPPPPPPSHHYSHGPPGPPHWHPHPNIPWPGRPPHVTSSYTSYSMFTPPRPGPPPPPPPPPLSQVFMSPAFPPNINSHLPPPPPMPPVPPHPMTNASGQQDEALTSMLMSWYLSGYYTGYYQGSHGSKQRLREKPPVQPDTTNTQEPQQHAEQQAPVNNQKKTPSN